VVKIFHGWAQKASSRLHPSLLHVLEMKHTAFLFPEFNAVRCLSNHVQSNSGKSTGEQNSWSKDHQTHRNWGVMLGGCALIGGAAILAVSIFGKLVERHRLDDALQ
jgi:hypothetical protein